MNVFIIPSWYPSKTDPITGIFFKEQAVAMARQYEDSNFGISTWGQNDERLLLWAGQPVKSLLKLRSKPKKDTQFLHRNLVEFFKPTYTWTSKIRKGNFDQILKANKSIFYQFEKTFGKVDIIHAHVGYPAGNIAKFLSESHGIPYVITEHMSPFPHKYFLTKNRELTPGLDMAYKFSSRNICVSQALEESMNSFGIANTCVIPNVVDGLFFKPKKTNSDRLEILSIGRLEKQKGFTYLLEAFHRIHQKYSNAHLKIIGEGSLRYQLIQKIHSLDLMDSVSFVGTQSREQVRDAMQSCTLFVLASIHENLPLVLLEAIACGKPVVTTICNGPEEIVNKTNGRLAELKNADDLSLQIDHVLTNIDAYKSDDIRSDFENRYSNTVVCKKIYETYLQSIASYNKQP